LSLSAQFGSAIAVSLANIFGLPVSSSQAIVGGVIGVGIASGMKVEKGIVREIVIGWIATPTTALIIALGIFKLFQIAGLL